jgi:Tol biopolymer transport system component/tRNA A-37 threonylcarbamoyl transferase component Bud32
VAVEAGQRLLHYRLIEKIGEGGMGVVWKAEDTKLHRHVALKVLPERMAADPERRARFEREARAVAALNHPNIVTLYSVEESDGVHFITMEMVEGRNLAQLLPRGGFPLNRLLEIAIPLADAVSRAHRAGVTHRDLKPDNVMIDAEGRLRVLDFGLAKLQEPTESAEAAHLPTATAMTGEGKIVGTVAYMSPEQAEGKPVDHRSDIFSLGTILYEMTTGQRPFQGETSMSTIGAILKDEPSSVTEINPALPRHAGRILGRCLAKDPDRRYQTALDLRNELEALKGEIDSGVHDAGPAPAVPASRRTAKPILVGAGAVAVVAIAVLIAVGLQDRGGSVPVIYDSRPITATSACDISPSWSHDGKYIGFSRITSGNVDVYVKPIDGGEAVVRAQGPGDQDCARWSPDGALLAYVSTVNAGTPIFLVPPDGGTPRELIETDLLALDYRIAFVMGDRPWSGDGRTLLVAKATPKAQIAIHRVEIATGEAQQISFPSADDDDYSPSYSFDGKRIAFSRSTQRGSVLMAMPAEGGEAEILYGDRPVDEAIDAGAFAWRPDNRRIVFPARRGINWHLFDFDLATRKVDQLTSGTGYSGMPSVSVEDRLLYSWGPHHDTFLYVVDVESGEREQLTSHSMNNDGARFSPDGRSIAYASDRTGDQEIWLHHLDGRSETQFTEHPESGGNPEWSPNGQRLVFLSSRQGDVPKLFVANADGGGGARLLVDQAINLGRGGASVHDPVVRWSPDGGSIAYRTGGVAGPELWTVGSDGLDARKRLDGVTGFDWYLDDRRGLITRRRGSGTELLAVDLESGREETLFTGALQEIDVAPDGSAVAFCYGRGHASLGLAVLRLKAPSTADGLPRAIGEPEHVVRAERSWHVHNGGWSPDSKRIVYTHDRDYGDIYELVERQ